VSTAETTPPVGSDDLALAAHWKKKYQREQNRSHSLRRSRDKWKREALDWRRTLWRKKVRDG
jgi:hypothetical protein